MKKKDYNECYENILNRIDSIDDTIEGMQQKLAKLKEYFHRRQQLYNRKKNAELNSLSVTEEKPND